LPNMACPLTTSLLARFMAATPPHEQFVFPLPDGLISEDATSMTYASLIVVSPLILDHVDPGKKASVIGIGGPVSIFSFLSMLP
jgi:D-arabinose 1-dehydrogenase-like Zn-dependent alcohol dehydrogenase